MSNEPHRIFSPITHHEFFSTYWEKEPLHIQRKDSTYFADLVSIQDIDTLLSNTAQNFPDLQLADANRSISASDYRGSNQRIDAAAVRKLHLEGATVILSGAHMKVSALADLCRSVTSYFVMRSQSNVYLSPASQQGFNPHFDTHDVFILQAAGSKTFRFYTSDIELPFTDDTFDPSLCENAELQEQVTVNAGDTLYIPRGVVHDAVACGEQPSLHITLGVFPTVLRDLLQEVMQVAGENDVALRRSLVDGKRLDSQELLAVLESAINDEVVQSARSRLVDGVALGDSSAASCSLQSGQLQLDSVVQLKHANLINVETHGDSLKIRLHGQILEFEGSLALAAHGLLNQQRFVVGKIPELDDEQCITLCNQLYASGLIELQAARS